MNSIDQLRKKSPEQEAQLDSAVSTMKAQIAILAKYDNLYDTSVSMYSQLYKLADISVTVNSFKDFKDWDAKTEKLLLALKAMLPESDDQSLKEFPTYVTIWREAADKIVRDEATEILKNGDTDTVNSFFHEQDPKHYPLPYHLVKEDLVTPENVKSDIVQLFLRHEVASFLLSHIYTKAELDKQRGYAEKKGQQYIKEGWLTESVVTNVINYHYADVDNRLRQHERTIL